jgi:long-chain fatty acid transport protein
MRRKVFLACLMLSWPTYSMAGGVERSAQSAQILFEQGMYFELEYSYFHPDVSGSVRGGQVESGNMVNSHDGFDLGGKASLVEGVLDGALVYDHPIGADIHYPGEYTLYPLAGTTASIDSEAVTLMLRYHLPMQFSLIGGPRAVRTSGDADIARVASYSMHTSTELDLGYLVGVAWEYPELNARAILSYNSEVEHEFTAREYSSLVPSSLDTEFSTTLPQSVNFEFRCGIATDLALFGSIRWVDWSAFDVAPSHWVGTLGQYPLVEYTDDTVTYTLGLGYQFTESWGGAVILGYEDPSGERVGNLGPMDGITSGALALKYTYNIFSVTAACKYVDIGDATTHAPISGYFDDNSGWGGSLKLSFSL